MEDCGYCDSAQGGRRIGLFRGATIRLLLNLSKVAENIILSRLCNSIMDMDANYTEILPGDGVFNRKTTEATFLDFAKQTSFGTPTFFIS